MSRANICIVVQLVVALAMPGEDAAPSWWGGGFRISNYVVATY